MLTAVAIAATVVPQAMHACIVSTRCISSLLRASEESSYFPRSRIMSQSSRRFNIDSWYAFERKAHNINLWYNTLYEEYEPQSYPRRNGRCSQNTRDSHTKLCTRHFAVDATVRCLRACLGCRWTQARART